MGLENNLPEGWVESTLNELAFINPRESIRKGDLAKNVPMDCIDSFTRKISRFGIKEFKGGTKFKNKDTLLARITPCLENGKTALVDLLDKDEIGFGSTEYIVIRENKDKSHYKFLYYLTISPKFRRNAIKAMTGTSGRQRVQTDLLINKVFRFPPLPEQKAIAKVLTAFDDKIELLQAQNKTLESMAQTIFKEWFGKYQIGNELPEGWRLGNIGKSDFCKILGSGINSFEGEKTYIATADVTNSDITNTNTKINLTNRPSRANMQPVGHSIWFAKMQDSRKLIIVDQNSHKKIDKMIFSTGFAGIKTTKLSHYYMSCFILSKEFDSIKNNLANGAVQISINNTNIKTIEIIIPDKEILNRFNKITKHLFQKISNNKSKIETLTKTRDTLLPKLMSGQVRVNNLKQLADA